jgi:hypothetical protein
MASEGWNNQLLTLIVLVEGAGFSGMFGYSPAPGAGNLELSISAQAGTDPYGNAYPAGVTVGNSTAPSTQINLAGGNPAAIDFIINDLLNRFVSASIYSSVTSLGGHDFATLNIQGPAITGHPANDDFMLMGLNSPNADGSSSANLGISYIDANLAQNFYVIIDQTGSNILACKNLRAYLPGTGTSATNPAQSETWHTASNPSGWSGTARYKLLAETNLVLIDFQLTHAGASGNVSVLTLPVAYRPAFNHAEPFIMTTTAGTAWPVTMRVTVQTDGQVVTSALPAGTTTIAATFICPID